MKGQVGKESNGPGGPLPEADRAERTPQTHRPDRASRDLLAPANLPGAPLHPAQAVLFPFVASLATL
jgi:hypothetical protein